MSLAGLTHTCSSCGAPQDRLGQRLCSVCHAEYQRKWRQKRTRKYRASVRSDSRKQKPKIRLEPCTVCGNRDVELHHPDHEMATLTVWMCRPCHVLWHEHWKMNVLNIFCEWLEMARACAAVRHQCDAEEAAAAATQQEAA